MGNALATRRVTPAQRKNSIRQLRASGRVARRDGLPEYLEPTAIEGLMRHAPNVAARLLMLCQWRAGLRVSEALALEVADLDFAGRYPTVKIRRGKGNKARMVPAHPELIAGLQNYLDYGNIRRGPLFEAHRATVWRWAQTAVSKATSAGLLPPGKRVGTHTLRHSAARHWLASGVPINVVSLWLGHASIQTTLVYLKLLPDPMGYMERVP